MSSKDLVPGGVAEWLGSGLQSRLRGFESRLHLGATTSFKRLSAIGAAVARFPDTEEVTGSIPVSRTGSPEDPNADVAQLVAHHLAKVRVASSSLVIRSKAFLMLEGISSK